MIPDNAPLRIASWCWPERAWDPKCIESNSTAFSGGPHGNIFFDCTKRDDVAEAERVVIERGLAEDYGCALVDDLGLGEPPGPDGPSPYEVWGRIATAPLDARVRALLNITQERDELRAGMPE